MARAMEQHIATKTTQTESVQGTLLGVVVDLSGSMQENLKNDDGGQYSRIETLSESFHRVIETIEKLVANMTMEESAQFRLFVYGFGLCVKGQPICDILAALRYLKKNTTRYNTLQSELKKAWLLEIEHVLGEGRVLEDAKEQLRLFIEQELRDNAIKAEQKRSVATFQRWCILVCHTLDKYEANLRTMLMRWVYLAIILNPIVLGLLWILRGPTIAMAKMNKFFEDWVQSKLLDIRTNAHTYSIQLADKVVFETKQALDAHQKEISDCITSTLMNYLDNQSLEIIRLKDAGSTKKERKETLSWNELKPIFEDIKGKIERIIRPQASSAWNKNIFIFKQATRALRIKPNWELLRKKTTDCAYQAVWSMTEPFVQQIAEDFAQQRYIKAVLATTVKTAKDKEETLPIQNLPTLLQPYREAKLSIEELPIFGASVMGQALTQTFGRFQREMLMPKNKKLRPVLLVISDGEVIDQVDALPITEKLKELGVIVICCFLANKNIGCPWVLRNRTCWFWPPDTKLMFSMASSVDDWPEFGKRLKDSRFVVKKRAKLFVQINHSEYLENVVNAVLLPLDREHG